MSDLVEEFDIFGTVLNYGNRSDLNDGDDWASWQADPVDDNKATITVWDDDSGHIRRFNVNWEEV